MELWTALVVGFFGSFHCIGMCGPLALALPGNSGSLLRLVSGKLLYNLGRITTYTLLGAVIGIAGHSIAISGYQKLLSVLLGVSFVLYVLIRQTGVRFARFPSIDSLYRRVQNFIGRQYRKRGESTLFTIGVLNGFLPCGFVWLGLAGAATTGTVPESALYMTLFGVGTLPAMFAVSMAPHLIRPSFRLRIARLLPLFTLLLGLFLIWRGVAPAHLH